MQTLFPDNSPSVPFLLSYPLMVVLVLNLRQSLHSLFIHSTGLRRQFVQVLLSGFDQPHLRDTLSKILGFSTKTFSRASKLAIAIKPVIDRKPKKVVRKSVIPPQVFADARRILDVIAPVKSGKQFRVVTSSLSFLYQQYTALAQTLSPLAPLCYTTFIGKVLDIRNNYVHFERNPDFCPHCRECDELEALFPAPTPEQQSRLAMLHEHKRIAKVQWNVYHQKLKDLLTNPSYRLVVQDFNQQHATTSLQTQILTLVVYAAPKGKLERHYFNYFLPTDQSNNVTAVIACHRDFFFNTSNEIMSSATHIDIFNDGGPKHFKLTAYLAHMSAVSENLGKKKKTLVQHYFASYHGSGPADAVASHMKRKLHWVRANFRHNPVDVAEMARICSQIANTDKAEVISVPPELKAIIKVKTCKGIKQYHKATFAPSQSVTLWVDSSSPLPSLEDKQLHATGVLL